MINVETASYFYLGLNTVNGGLFQTHALSTKGGHSKVTVHLIFVTSSSSMLVPKHPIQRLHIGVHL